MRLIKIRGVWHVRFQIAGKRMSRTTREKAHQRALPVAERIYREALALSRGERPTPTLAEAVSEWLTVQEHLKSEAHIRSVELFGRRQLYGLGGLYLHQIGTAEVERALAEHAKSRSVATSCAWLRNLRLIFHWAMRRKMLRAIPWQVGMPKLQKRRKATIPVAKVGPWLDALDEVTDNPHVRLACRLMLFLGLREMEALGARWENLDFETKTYTPHKTKGKEAHAIPADLVVDYLRPMAKPFGLMMPGPSDGQHGHDYCKEAIRAANAKAGTPGISNHRLRGTFATLLHCVAGCDVQTVQRAMRHKDPRTTLAYLESVSDLAVSAGLERLKAQIGKVRLKSGEMGQAKGRHG